MTTLQDLLGLITNCCFCWLFIFGTLSQNSLAAVHDELPQCELQGVYRQRQSLIQSTNYPDNYPSNTCVDYVIRSPYRCPTTFHIQFLDFKLELSENCSRDYFAIGLQTAEDDMDVLCGQVLGIKKYHTPDGILRLRFLSDDSPWTTDGGYRLLITRLACERDDLAARGLDVDDEDDDDTVQVNAKLPPKKLLEHHHHLLQQQQPNQLQFNLSLPQQQAAFQGWPGYYPGYQPQAGFGYPAYGPSLGSGFGGGFYLPVAQPPPTTLPSSGLAPPCTTNEPQQHQQQQQQQQQQQFQQLQQQQLQQLQQQHLQQQQQQLQQQLPAITDQYQTTSFQPQNVNLKDYDSQNLQQFGGQVDLCCVSSFNQAHFYLSSPGFPRTVLNALLPNQQRDCVFYLEKSSPNVGGLRIHLKFFDFGQRAGGLFPGQGAAGCQGDFLEVDGQRYCGCRSGHVHKSFWPEGRKALRLRMGHGGGAASNGFLLEIYQDQDTNNYRGDGVVPPGLPGAAGLPGFSGQVGLPGQIGLPGLSLPGGYQPQLGGYQPQLGGYQPQVGGYQPQLGGYQPQLGGYQPQVGGYQPQLGYQPGLTGYRPQTQTPPLWANYPGRLPTSNYPLSTINPLLPPAFTPYRQSRQASWAWARGLDAQQPARVVETNSTRKEFYYFDADEAFARAALDDDDAKKTSVSAASVQPLSTTTKAFEQSSCTFDYMEVLRLSVDTLWLTKPICFAPLRSWFSNIFG